MRKRKQSGSCFSSSPRGSLRVAEAQLRRSKRARGDQRPATARRARNSFFGGAGDEPLAISGEPESGKSEHSSYRKFMAGDDNALRYLPFSCHAHQSFPETRNDVRATCRCGGGHSGHRSRAVLGLRTPVGKGGRTMKRCFGPGRAQHAPGCRPGRPLCRWARKIRETRRACFCAAYAFPHRNGSGACAEGIPAVVLRSASYRNERISA